MFDGQVCNPVAGQRTCPAAGDVSPMTSRPARPRHGSRGRGHGKVSVGQYASVSGRAAYNRAVFGMLGAGDVTDRVRQALIQTGTYLRDG